ncbi:MAG: tyrosine-type recombinase/integrase [Nitrospiraceae bacterium]|nr:tyrosine-type recombinase/integrase [Nitrospiraceae bacterium]
MSEHLTDIEAIEYLLSNQQQGEKMPGTIRTKEKCPNCKKQFKHIVRIGFICPKCKTTPKKYFIDLHYQNQRIKVYSHRTGRILDSYSFAGETLEHIRHELRTHTFDPSKYIASEQVKFYFSVVAEKWLTEKTENANRGLLAYSTVMELKRYNEHYFKPFFGNKDIRDIRRYDIDDFKSSLPDHLAPKTIKNIFTAIKNLFNTAYQKELIEKLPTFPKIENTEYNGWKWISAETQINILNTIPEQDRPIFAFLFLHGVRTGEARALKLKDIDIQGNIIRIRRTWTKGGDGKEIIRETTKQKKENIIPLHPEMKPFFESLKTFPESFVFLNPRTQRPYSDDALRKTWYKTVKTLGLENEGIRLYDATRHSYASQLVNANVPLNIISKLLGHSSVKMTQRYAHTNLNTLQTAITTISLLPPKQDKQARNE